VDQHLFRYSHHGDMTGWNNNKRIRNRDKDN